MRIVEINTVCDTGSTGRIAAGVARIARQRGHEVYFAYGRGHHPEDISGYKIGNRIDFVFHVLLNFFKGKSGFGSKLVTKRFIGWLDYIQPDVIHLHNLHGFYIHVGMLFEYIKRHDIRVIWTLHDCWPFTGQCAYFDYAECDKWKDGCYDCPIYRTNYPYSLFCDNSKANYQKKKELFAGVSRLLIVTPSSWLNSLVRESFLGDYDSRIINNGIDTDVFRVLDKNSPTINRIREKYEIIADKKIVLGVANIWDHRKGLDEFCGLSDRLNKEQKTNSDIIIVLIGVSGHIAGQLRRCYSGRILGIEHTESLDELVAWYNIADVFVNPTLEDNFPTTNIEALACGTPVVTYDTGGSPEAIDEICGRIVKKGDISSLTLTILDMIDRKSGIADDCVKRANDFKQIDRLAEYVDIMESATES